MRKNLFEEIELLSTHSNGNSWQDIYQMPIFLRKFFLQKQIDRIPKQKTLEDTMEESTSNLSSVKPLTLKNTMPTVKKRRASK